MEHMLFMWTSFWHKYLLLTYKNTLFVSSLQVLIYGSKFNALKNFAMIDMANSVIFSVGYFNVA